MRPTKAQGQHETKIKNKLLSFRGATPITSAPNDVLKIKRPITTTKPLSETLKDLQAFINSFNEKRKREKRNSVISQ
jgi:DNA-directed RNA polymerase beta' subunit